MKKRALKKAKKKTTKKSRVKPRKTKAKAKKKTSTKKKAVVKAPKHIGVVTHFYTDISVAIVTFNKKVPAGSKLHYKGATTDFVDAAKSMQYDHQEIAAAPKGKQIGIKVKKRVREGDKVHFAE